MKDKLSFIEIDGRVPKEEKMVIMKDNDIYYLPEWIIKEDDTEEKYRKCITR